MSHAWRTPGRDRIPAFVLLAVLTGCTGSTEVITPPPPPAAALTLTFVPAPEDVATAQALGWGTGLPGLTVSVAPADSSRPPRTFTSGADGTVDPGSACRQLCD